MEKRTASLHERMNKKDSKGCFVISLLPYADDFLEPYIGARTINYHYWHHLLTYIDKVNILKASTDATIEEIIRTSFPYKTSLYNNASQVFNHYFYFEQFSLKRARHPLQHTATLIEKRCGSLNSLKKVLISCCMEVFGSGWVFLTTDKEGETLWVRPFIGTGTPIEEFPLLAIDVWEHAYYLDYQNNRRAYFECLFEILDWSVVERRLLEIRGGTINFAL